MDSLIEINIEPNVIESMKTCYSENEINSIDNNPKDLIASILLLREIGVNEDIINKILKYKNAIKKFEELVNIDVSIEDETKDEIR